MTAFSTAAALALLLIPGAGQDPPPSGIDGKVFVGYQGWFAAEGDGSDRSWYHYSKSGKFEPGRCTIDLWPDVSELEADETFETPFRHRDGRPARVFSSYSAGTVDRHFRWMAEYGIDGAFVQRFATRLRGEDIDPHWERVLENCRKAAAHHGRAWAVMYDLSGLGKGEVGLVQKDWKRLVSEVRVTEDRDYLRHRGRPLVAVWGVGFSDGRPYTLAECLRLIEFLKSPEGGRSTVLLGIPSFWRERRRDAVNDDALHGVLARADVLSPWSVGRYADPETARAHADQVWAGDLRWCRKRGLDYLPVVFPGFSWHNMNPQAPLDQIPRLKGRFLWRQFHHAQRAGARSVYVAMFDEIDEATAIFKCTNDPPVGKSPFLTYEGMPPDHYLWLTGRAARAFAAGTPLPENPPRR